eukprot:6033993-Prymnesium_polylepis.1
MREREDLEAAAVGDQRPPLAAHEAVEAAGAADDVGARMDQEMVRVGEHELHASLVGLPRIHELDRAVRADRHEARRVHDAVRRVDSADARAAAARLVQHLELEEVARAPLGERPRVGPRASARRAVQPARRQADRAARRHGLHCSEVHRSMNSVLLHPRCVRA